MNGRKDLRHHHQAPRTRNEARKFKYLLLGVLRQFSVLHTLSHRGNQIADLKLGLHTMRMELGDGGVGLFGHFPAIRVRDLVHALGDQRHDFREQRMTFTRVVNQLTHVVHDHAAAALALFGLGVETAPEDGGDDGQVGGFDILDEDASGELLDALLDLGEGWVEVERGWDWDSGRREVLGREIN